MTSQDTAGKGRRLARWLVVVGAVTLLGSGVWSWFRPLEATAESELHEVAGTPLGYESSRPSVQVTTARRGVLPIESEATGYLESERRIELAMDTAGRVASCAVHEGALVSAGQLLMRLDSRDRELEVEEAKAEWLKIRAEHVVRYESESWQADQRGERELDGERGGAEANTAVERQADPDQLYAQGLISKNQVADMRRKHQAADFFTGRRQKETREVMSGLVQAEQRLAKASLALERTVLHAPFTGRIANVNVEAGQVVSSGEVVFELIATDRLKVDVDVLAADMIRMRPGAPARVRVPSLGEQIMEGTVHTVNPMVDPDTGMGRLTVTLPNRRGLLMPGLFAYVDLEVRRLEDRLLIPAAALLERQGRELVFRIQDDRALWTYVETGARSSEWVEVTKGLDAGSTLAVAGHFALVHEAPVDIAP